VCNYCHYQPNALATRKRHGCGISPQRLASPAPLLDSEYGVTSYPAIFLCRINCNCRLSLHLLFKAKMLAWVLDLSLASRYSIELHSIDLKCI